MKRIAIVFHSAHGHTRHIAGEVAAGARSVPHTLVRLFTAEEAAADPGPLTAFDGLLLGTPTYLGGVSSPFKAFMDATGRMWRQQSLRGKLAAGFTVSSLPSGDKQTTLVSLFTFAMQHGMQWVGNPVLPEQHQGVPEAEAANRLGSWSGLMAQSAHGGPADAFVPGDLKSARLFGSHFARTLQRVCAIDEPAVLS